MSTAPRIQPTGRARPRILFAVTSHYLPEYTGGVESTTHEMCLALAARGCEVAVMSRTRRMSRFAWRARANMLLGRKPVAQDQTLGYPVLRSRSPLDMIDTVCDEFHPTLAVVQIGRTIPLARAFAARGVPAIVFLHNLNFHEMGGGLFADPNVRYATVSEFMASAVEARFGIRPQVVTPLIQPERYATESARETVAFVNPTGVKGLQIALHLARKRPGVSFEFVESWPLDRSDWSALKSATADLPNIRLLRRTADMRAIYSRARLLLVPSQWEEPWGRVAGEAHLSGIPVLASRIGGLPEAVGPGGVLVSPHDSPETWEREFAALWDDPDAYRRCADAALAYARRPDIQPEHIVSRFLELAAAEPSQ